MSQGTRLLLFHEDGELKQIFFPRLSPLWFLSFLSTLSLLTAVLIMLSLRLYHEKRATLNDKALLDQRVLTSELKIKELLNEKRPPQFDNFSDKVVSLLTPHGFEDFDAANSPVEVTIDPNSTELLDGGFRIKFGVMAKDRFEDSYQGSVCGVFFTKDRITFLENSKTNASWVSLKKQASFKNGSNCDPFWIKSGKWFEVKLPSQLESGVVQVYSGDGQLLHVRVLQSAK